MADGYYEATLVALEENTRAGCCENEALARKWQSGKEKRPP
jgi:hypothetical protein